MIEGCLNRFWTTIKQETMSRTPAANGITASLSLVFIPLWDFLFTKAHSRAAVSGEGQMVVDKKRVLK